MNRIMIAMLLGVLALTGAALLSPSTDAKADTPDPVAEAQARAARLVKAKHAARADENRKHARIYTQIDHIGAAAARRGDAKLRSEAERAMLLEGARYAEALARIDAMEHVSAGAEIVVLPLQPTTEERAVYEAAAKATLAGATAQQVLADLAEGVTATR